MDSQGTPIGFACALAQFLSESDEKPFWSPDVAEPIRVLISHYFSNELCTTFLKPLKCLVDVIHSEHYPEVAQGIHGGVAVICDN